MTGQDRSRAVVPAAMAAGAVAFVVARDLHGYWWWLTGGSIVIFAVIITAVVVLHRKFTPLYLSPWARDFLGRYGDDQLAAASAVRARAAARPGRPPVLVPVSREGGLKA